MVESSTRGAHRLMHALALVDHDVETRSELADRTCKVAGRPPYARQQSNYVPKHLE